MPAIGEQKRVGDTVGRWDGQTWRRVPQQPQEEVDANVGTVLGQNYHPTSGDTPGSAALHEIVRTGVEAGKGLLHSPIDLLSNLFHPIDGLMGAAHAVTHPSEALASLVNDPKAAGSALGQTLLGEKLPGMAADVASAAPAVLGKGAATVGRGLEAAGKSAPAKLSGKWGPGAFLAHPTPVGAAVSTAAVAAPPALRGLGRVLQKFGPAIEEALPGSISAGDRALLVKQGYSDAAIAKIEASAQKAAAPKAAPAPALKGVQEVARPKSAEVPYRASEPTGVEGLNAPIEHAQYEPVAKSPDLMDEFQTHPSQNPQQSFVQDTLNGPQTMQMDEGGSHVAVEEPGNLKFNNAGTNSPASLKALNDLVSTKTSMPDMGPVPDARALLEQVHANEGPVGPGGFTHEGFLDQLKQSAGAAADTIPAPVDELPVDLSPLDRLSRLSQARARGQSFRTGTPLTESF